MKKSLTRLAVAGALVASTLGFASTSTHAASTAGDAVVQRCSGRVTRSGNFTENGKVVGKWSLYRSYTGLGSWCAMTQNLDKSKRHTVGVTMIRTIEFPQIVTARGTTTVAVSMPNPFWGCPAVIWSFDRQTVTASACGRPPIGIPRPPGPWLTAESETN